MSQFEDAVSHTRMQDNVSPSPATRGTLGGAPGPGQRSDSSSTFNKGGANTVANPLSQLTPNYPDAPGGALSKSGELSGIDQQSYTPGGEFDAANNASSVTAHDCANIWPDAQGGNLGHSKQ